MKKLLLLPLLGAVMLLGGCASPPPPQPMASTCYVHDYSGRHWYFTSMVNPCGKALSLCRQWHYNHPGIQNWRCIVY